MTRLLALLAVLSLSAPAVAQEKEDIVTRIRRLWGEGKGEEIAGECDRFKRDHPHSSRIPEILLLELQYLQNRASSSTAQAIGILRTLHQEHSETPEAQQSASLVPTWTGWNWTSFPAYLHSQQTKPQRIELGRAMGQAWAPQPTPTIEIFKLPVNSRRELLRRVYAGADDERVPRPIWQKILAAPLKPTDGFLEWTSFSPGRYLVEERLDAFRNRTVVTVSRFAMLVKYSPGKLVVFTCDPVSGGSCGGIEVEAGGEDFTVRGKTGLDGLLLMDCPRPRGVMAWSGDDLQECGLDYPKDDSVQGPKVYITTDRPVYRPGQTVFYKAIHRELNSGVASLPAKRSIRIEVLDSGGRCLQKQDAEWSDLGTIMGSFRIGEEPPLGDYCVRVDVPREDRRYYDDEGGGKWSQSFQVAAYRKPDVSVSIEFPGDGVVPGTSFMARIRATAYHGGPVANADVSWSAGPCYASPKPQPRIFEDPLGWFVQKPERPWYYDGSDEPSDYVAEGSGKTGPDGTLDVVIPTKSHPDNDHWGIRATVRDLSRLESTGSGGIDVRPGALRLSVGTRRLFYAADEEFEGLVRVTTADGKPAAGRSVELSGLIQRKIETDKEREYESVYRGIAKSDDSGLAVFKIRSAESGILRLKAAAKDGNGRKTTERTQLRIAGDEADLDDGPELIADRLIYQEGDTARLLLRVPNPGASAVLTLESGALHEVRTLRLERTNQILEIPLNSSHAPNVVVHLSAWKGGQWMGGGTELLVVPAKRVLDVAVQADRPHYAPRERATIRISTTLDGQGANSEVELAVVDESIFALKPESFPDLRTFFLPLRSGSVPTWTTWFWSQNWDTPTRGEGIGMLTGAAFALEEAKVSDEPTLNFATAETRRWFPDTLKWIGNVRTDDEGRASVEVEMPDSLTSWRIVARAVSGRDAFGQGRSSTLTRKNVIVRLSAPRFYVVGDEGVVSAVVRNNLPGDQEFSVRLHTAGVEANAAPSLVKVGAGREERVDWTLKITKPGTITLKAEALGKVESDAMEIEVPVKEHGDDRVATASGGVQGTWHADLTLPEHAPTSSARLELRITGPGSDAILEALPSLIGYPYGCVEQTMSRFLPAVTAGRALARLKIPAPALQASLPGLVDQGLQRLYGFQHEDGGWGWWKLDETHPRMTAYVVYGLALARDSGYPVDEKSLNAGIARLKQMPPTPFGNFALKQAGGEVSGEAKPDSDEDVAWLVLSGRRESIAALNTKAPTSDYEHDVRRVSLTIQALVSIDRNDPRIVPLLDWLLAHRRGGGWVSTLDTAWAVFALTDLLQGEPPRRDVRARINGKEVQVENSRVLVDSSFLKAGVNRIEVESTQVVFASALLRFVLDEESPAPVGGAIVLSRSFERLIPGGDEPRWEALESGSLVHPGDELRMTLSIRSPLGAEYVMIESPIAAGTEARQSERDDWGSWYGRQELRDDRVCVAAMHVWEGVNEYRCRLHPTQPGKYHLLPARAWPMYNPDVRASSGEFILRVADR